MRSHHTYGGDKGLYELGIILFSEKESGLAKTNLNPDGDVFGYLDPPEVVKLLLDIIKLAPCQDPENVFVSLPKIEKVKDSIKGIAGSEFVETFNEMFGEEKKSSH